MEGRTSPVSRSTSDKHSLCQLRRRGGEAPFLGLRDAELDVHAGQAVIVHRGEWVQYGTPGAEGAEYVAVCLPAFAPDAVHRDG
jgi:hypothetical protein